MRTKIDYGIDLGTTNSVIARIENGTPVIKKTDRQMDILPSCIHFNKKQDVLVGDIAYSAMKSDKIRAMKDFRESTINTFMEFKRTMGSDATYFSSNMDRTYNSEELSAELLKQLKSFGHENVNAIVITVPAKFTINQKDATVRAAHLAGFKHVELIHEPIAASIAYGLTAEGKDGYWLVFDFGGGTFDAALLKVAEGIMKVKDTEGDNFLGGKNLDEAIVDGIIIPWLQKNYAINEILQDAGKTEILRSAMKFYAEDAKIQLTSKDNINILSDPGDIPCVDDNGNEIELDINITQQELETLFVPIFQQSINICKALLTRNNLSSSQLGSLILVGGPTYSPILRRMLKEQVTEMLAVNCDPMTAVAKGAAMYAGTLDIPENIINETRDSTMVQISIGYEATTVELTEWIMLKLLKNKTAGILPEKMFAEITRGDKAWSSGKIPIDDKGEMFEVLLETGSSNSFEVRLSDIDGNKLECQPDRFTIFQGIKPGEAVLPYHIGIEVYDEMLKAPVFVPAKGLEKNQKIPNTGVLLNLKTPKQIRPGMEEDYFIVPIYQGEHNAPGTRAIYNDHVYDVKISGGNLPALLPQSSEVEITIKADRSEQMQFSAFFPHLNFTKEIKVDTRKVRKVREAAEINEEITHAKKILSETENDENNKEVLEIMNNLEELEKQLEQGKENTDRRLQVLEHLRKELKAVDRIKSEVEWPKTEQELKDRFSDLEELVKQINLFDDHHGLNMPRIEQHVAELKSKIEKTIDSKDKKSARELIHEVYLLDFKLRDPFVGMQRDINNLKYWDKNFDITEWINTGKARALIDRGLKMADDNPTKSALREIVNQLFDLLVDKEKVDGNLLIRDESVSIWSISRKN